jgi:hypothetical protein
MDRNIQPYTHAFTDRSVIETINWGFRCFKNQNPANALRIESIMRENPPPPGGPPYLSSAVVTAGASESGIELVDDAELLTRLK